MGMRRVAGGGGATSAGGEAGPGGQAEWGPVTQVLGVPPRDARWGLQALVPPPRGLLIGAQDAAGRWRQTPRCGRWALGPVLRGQLDQDSARHPPSGLRQVSPGALGDGEEEKGEEEKEQVPNEVLGGHLRPLAVCS